MKRVLTLLADGEFHSGEELGAALNLSRSAVWKLVKQLSDWDIDVHAITGRGYQLAESLELLDQTTILSGLTPAAQAQLAVLEIVDRIPSTNQYLLDLKTAVSGTVCLAESQTQGRGRRSRHWVSPFGSHIYLSLLWQFPGGATHLTSLSLAVAVMVVEALQQYGLQEIGLKWPNDIFYRGSKLAGILLEISGNIDGPYNMVIGIGLNVAMPKQAATQIDQPWTDIQTILGKKPARNHLISLLLNQLLTQLPVFQQHGFAAFQQRWQQWDLLIGQSVTLHMPTQDITGIVQGIDPDSGYVVLQTNNGELQHFASGELSVEWRKT